MRELLLSPAGVEQWNDAFARQHDIDAYYARASGLIRWVEGRRLAMIRSMLDAQPGHRLLEVGCGGGHVLRMYPECQLTGADVSGEMLAKAKRNLSGLNVRLLKGELDQLSLTENSFDRIICSEVLEHVVDPKRLLAAMHRLLSPSGRAVVTIPNDALIHRIKALIRNVRLDVLPPLRNVAWGGDEYHLHEWTISQMQSLLSQYFSVIGVHFAPVRLLPIRICFAVTPRA